MNNFDYFNSVDAGRNSDANWCPDCGEMRGVCACQENRAAHEALYPDEPDNTPICWGCGWPMIWNGDEREIALEGGELIVYEPIYRCENPNCGSEDELYE